MYGRRSLYVTEYDMRWLQVVFINFLLRLIKSTKSRYYA